jgi:hypothetical protein
MWTPEVIAALSTAVVSVLGAVTALVVALRQRSAVASLKAGDALNKSIEPPVN